MVEVRHQRGSVADLHGLDPFAGRTLTDPEVWWCEPTDDAVVLGSRQAADLVDESACARAGLSIVRRRSGGGAVLLRSDAVVWIDAVLPHGVAPDDVRGSMVWIGERWRQVLAESVARSGAASGVDGRSLEVHRGGMVASPWSDLVCFAGVGPGEVLAGGRKLLGLSQRRTRHGLRLQGLVYRRPITSELPTVLTGALPAVSLVEPDSLPDLAGDVVASRLAALLSAS